MSGQQSQEGSIFSGEPKGSIDTEFLGNSYFSPAPPSTSSAAKKNAVLLCTDGSGLAVPHGKFVADELAKQLECDVWIPDYFLGKPVIPPSFLFMPERAGVKISWWTWIKFIFTVAIPNIQAILSNLPYYVDPRLEAFIQQLKEQKKYEKIGAVGYWYGGSVCIRLASKPDLLNTVVICHPGKFTIENVKDMKIPNSWVCSEGKTSRGLCGLVSF
jgi:dienelactone hydrolase